MKRKIFLHGRLKALFGEEFSFDVGTAAEALRALNCAFPGRFVDALREGSYQIIRGRRHGGMSLDLNLVSKLQLGRADLHIIPVAAGSGSKGSTVKAIVGVALIGTAIFFSGGTLAAPLAGMGGALPLIGTAIPGLTITWGNIALLGLGVALSGIASSMAKGETGTSEGTDPANSWTFSGPVNVSAQGGARPLIYGGPILVGSIPISSSFDIENLGAL